MAESGGTLRELLAVFSFGVDTKELKEGGNKLEEFFGKVRNIATGIAGAFAAHEIFEFAEGQAKAATAIERTGAALGISAEKVQEFQFASKSLGMEQDRLLGLMGRMQVAQQAAAKGTGLGAKSFAELGVSVKDSSGKMKSADELFLDVADGIAKIEDPSKAAAVATQIFGRSGRELLPFLKEGRKGAEELFGAYKDLGGGYTEEMINKSKEFEKSQAKLNLVNKGLKSQISSALLPVLTKLTDWATRAVHWFGELTKNSKIFQAAMVVLAAAGTAFGIAMAIANAPILLVAAAIAFLIGLVDDIIVTFQGGDSLIRRALDNMFGKGFTTDAVDKLKHAWEAVAQAIKDAWEWAKKHQAQLNSILDKLPPIMLGRAVRDMTMTARSGGLEAPDLDHKMVPFMGKMQPFHAPMMPPGERQAPSDTVININQNLPAGLNEKQVGEHTAKAVHDVVKQIHRDAAMAVVQRSGQP